MLAGIQTTLQPGRLLQVEIKTTKDTPDVGNLQKAADFVQAFILGKRRHGAALHVPNNTAGRDASLIKLL